MKIFWSILGTLGVIALGGFITMCVMASKFDMTIAQYCTQVVGPALKTMFIK